MDYSKSKVFTDIDSFHKFIVNIKNPTLFLIVGLPYSGKSFISKLISTTFNIPRVSFDETWQKLSKYNLDISWEAVNNNNLEYCKQVLSTGNHVILDTYTRNNKVRELINKFSKNIGVNFLIIYLPTDINIVKKRHKDNKLTPTSI
jgi:predicted kinase